MSANAREGRRPRRPPASSCRRGEGASPAGRCRGAGAARPSGRCGHARALRERSGSTGRRTAPRHGGPSRPRRSRGAPPVPRRARAASRRSRACRRPRPPRRAGGGGGSACRCARRRCPGPAPSPRRSRTPDRRASSAAAAALDSGDEAATAASSPPASRTDRAWTRPMNPVPAIAARSAMRARRLNGLSPVVNQRPIAFRRKLASSSIECSTLWTSRDETSADHVLADERRGAPRPDPRRGGCDQGGPGQGDRSRALDGRPTRGHVAREGTGVRHRRQRLDRRPPTRGAGVQSRCRESSSSSISARPTPASP